jgi:hypothetical protein
VAIPLCGARESEVETGREGVPHARVSQSWLGAGRCLNLVASGKRGFCLASFPSFSLLPFDGSELFTPRCDIREFHSQIERQGRTEGRQHDGGRWCYDVIKMVSCSSKMHIRNRLAVWSDDQTSNRLWMCISDIEEAHRDFVWFCYAIFLFWLKRSQMGNVSLMTNHFAPHSLSCFCLGLACQS